MLLMLAAPRSEACPRGTVCVASETRPVALALGTEIALEVAPVAEVPRKTMLDLAVRRDARSVDMLSRSLRTHVAPNRSAAEMPWIWQVLRRGVYARLPRYERVDLQQKFSMVLSPVVVESPQDTVPGVGIEGGF
jgi:hypothetical protein